MRWTTAHDEEIERLAETLTMKKIGEVFGASANSVHKRYLFHMRAKYGDDWKRIKDERRAAQTKRKRLEAEKRRDLEPLEVADGHFAADQRSYEIWMEARR